MGRRPYAWRVRRGLVLWPFALGLAFCALTFWSASAYLGGQAAFRAHSLPARAVIDRIYAGDVYQGYDGSGFDQYALVHFQARGETAHARVLPVTGCRGVCFPPHHVGQVLTVYYDPQNPHVAQLPPSAKSKWYENWAVIIFFGFFGLMFLAAAAINTVTAPPRAGPGQTWPPRHRRPAQPWPAAEVN